MSLSDRMKIFEREFYSPELGYVNTNMPVFVRIDGKAFHMWTKKTNMIKPFDEDLSRYFHVATLNTCQEVGQVIMAYGQSDEVTFLLSGWQKPESQIYFGGKIQKIASVFASTFSVFFERATSFMYPPPPIFDARVFNVPKNEIENVFIWRQMDAKRNSIQALARSLYSQKELHEKTGDEMKKMCLDKGMVWDSLSPLQKWGFVVHRENYEVSALDGSIIVRSRWKVDTEIPFFVDDRNYINNLLKGE